MNIISSTYANYTLVIPVNSKNSTELAFLDYDSESVFYSKRQQVLDGFQIFHKIQSLFASNTLTIKMFKSSLEEYRSLINIKKEENHISDSVYTTDQTQEMMIRIWDLCDIAFFTDENELVVPILQLWLKFNHYKATKTAFKQVKTDIINNMQEYWNILYKLICIGQMEDAANALSLHPEYQKDNGFKFIEEILINWPEYDNLLISDPEQWNSKYLLFQKKLENFNSKYPSMDKNIQKIIYILLGRLEELDNNSCFMPSWFEMFLINVIYSTPTVKLFEFYRDSYRNMSIIKAKFKLTSNFDSIYESIMTKNIPLLHEGLVKTFNHLWFQTHFWDCFYKYSHITNKYISQSLDRIRDHSIYHYASILFQHGLWEIGTHLMVTCSSYNIQHTVLHLSKIKFQGEKEMLKMLRLTKQLNINDPESTLSRILICYYIRNQKHCDALLLSLEYSDRYYINFITNILIDIFLCRNKVVLQDMYNIVLKMNTDNQNLIFYCHLSEFFHLISFDYEKAIEKLFYILSSTLIPNQIYGHLVSIAIPAVLDKKKYLTPDQTVKLMELFNIWENSPTKHLKMINNQRTYEETSPYDEVEFYIKSALLNNLIP